MISLETFIRIYALYSVKESIFRKIFYNFGRNKKLSDTFYIFTNFLSNFTELEDQIIIMGDIKREFFRIENDRIDYINYIEINNKKVGLANRYIELSKIWKGLVQLFSEYIGEWING